MSVRGRGEEGETLIELIVAISIMGIAGVAIMTGLQFSVLSSTLGRSEATSDAYVRSLAEAIQRAVAAGGYQACSPTPNYLTAAVISQAALPSGYSPSQGSVQVWNPGAATWGSCVSSYDYAQRFTLTVTSPGSGAHQAIERLTIVVRKPCNGPSLLSPC